jgi:RNA recognition motif-containing protein
VRSVRLVFSRYGPLTDAAVFPARIGPLGYAFVNFEHVADATRAYDALNNSCIPSLTGAKQLKMRFKPAKVRALTRVVWDCAAAALQVGGREGRKQSLVGQSDL